MAALSMRGIECYRWTPDAGFQKFNTLREQEMRKTRRRRDVADIVNQAVLTSDDILNLNG